MQVRIIKERLVIDMDLKIGDLVAFKKYEYMTGEERYGINESSFPGIGTVSAVYDETNSFKIEEKPYVFSQKSIDYIIVKAAKENIRVGDEVLMKATIRKISGNHISFSWVNNNKGDVVRVLKRKEEHFIVQEDHYGMYVNGSEVLVVNKDDAKIFDSRNEANEVAACMHLNAWEVIPYDN